MAESGSWQLSGVHQRNLLSQLDGEHEDSDEEQQKRNRRRRRKPLPPIDLLGSAAPSNFPALHVAPHASAFSVQKPRHHYVVADDSAPTNNSGLGSLNVMTPSQVISPTAGSLIPKRTSSPILQNPLTASSTSSRTLTICCCIQVQFENGGRRCTRNFVWMMMFLSLICVFSVITVFVSYYSVDILHSRSRNSNTSSLLRKINTVFSTKEESWCERSTIPYSSERLDPITKLNLKFEQSNTLSLQFLTAAQSWSHDHLSSAPLHVLQPYGADFLNSRALFPNAKVYVLLNTWSVPKVDAVLACDESCQRSAQSFAAAAATDIEMEGFVTVDTLAEHQGGALGVLPALLASIHSMHANLLHVEDAPGDLGLSCLKFYLKDEHEEFVSIYCGDLDERNENQRMAIRALLKPMQPWALVLRAANYVLHPDVKPALDIASIAHFKAMLLALATLIVQDDSGIPLEILAKHTIDMALWGEYRGLGHPKLSGLTKVPSAVVTSLYQSDLAKFQSSGSLPFRFGYKNVIHPSTKVANKVESSEVYEKLSNFKGSHLMIATKK